MKYFLCKLASFVVICSYLQLTISPCLATPQDSAGKDLQPQSLQSHNCLVNPLIIIDRGTYLAGTIVKERDPHLTGVFSVSIISLMNRSLFKDGQFIPDNSRRFLTELGLGGRFLQEET